MTLEIQVLACDRHKNVMGLNRLMGFHPSPFDNWISDNHRDISAFLINNPLEICYESSNLD